MSNENTSIHQFDFSLIGEYFSSISRQGPGSPEMTFKALGYVDNLTSQSKIADLGCGTGCQTFDLAQKTSCSIIGIDLFPLFIDLFNQHAYARNLQHRVKGLVGSMDNLPFGDGEFDLIWSEGAIYNIGFERGITEWKRFLKEGGYIAVTDASWFCDERPAEIEEFWQEAYPQIDTIQNKVNQLQNAGFLPIANFKLPENCWIENYYAPQALQQEGFLTKYAGNHTAEALVANQRREAQLYHKYKAYYGYVFYIGKKL